MHASKATYPVRHPSPSCIVCNRITSKENERYRLYKPNEEQQSFSTAQKTMIGDLLKKIAMETKTLSIVEARCLKYVCNICRNVLVKVQRAQKHLEDAHKEYCTRLQARQTGLQPPLSRIPQPTPPLPALAPLKHARPSFSPSGVSPAARQPTLLPKSTQCTLTVSVTFSG